MRLETITEQHYRPSGPVTGMDCCHIYCRTTFLCPLGPVTGLLGSWNVFGSVTSTFIIGSHTISDTKYLFTHHEKRHFALSGSSPATDKLEFLR